MSSPSHRSLTTVLAVAALLSTASCYLRNKIPTAAGAMLEQADHFELLSLNPHYNQRPAQGDFHGYRIRGTAVIADRETRKKLISAFQQGVAENQGMIAACFNPRHGIRATRNGKQVDFVICFECAQVHSYGAVEAQFLISSSPKSLFDSVLLRAGISPPDE